MTPPFGKRPTHLRLHDGSADYVVETAASPTSWIRPSAVPTLTSTEPGRLVEEGLGTVRIDGVQRSIDHVAIVAPSPAVVDRMVVAFESCGASLVEPPHEFPDVSCEAPLPWQLGKYMASVELSRGVLVLSAPLRTDDQLDLHLRRYGAQVPHHLAVLVPDVRSAVGEWARRGYSFGQVTDDGSLAQVFGTSRDGTLVELISRADPHDLATFSCANIAALSQAEARLRREDGR